MAYFDFRRLIKKYSSEFTVIIPEENQLNDSGYWVGGEPTEKTLYGAVIGRGESTVIRSDGLLTAKDKRLFMLEPIEKALIGSKVIYDNEIFTIDNSTDNSKFTNVWAYTLKYVSAFNQKDGEGE